jgi:hypothetical protein
MLESLRSDAARPEAFYPYTYQKSAGDLRDGVLEGCRWCRQLGACINGHVLSEDVEVALTANNTSETDPLVPYQESSILVSDINLSNIDASARRQNTSIDEFDDDASQLSGSSDGMSIIGSDWSLDPAAVWDRDEDPDAAIYTSEFEITTTFEKDPPLAIDTNKTARTFWQKPRTSP